MVVRNNPVIWRIARWLSDRTAGPFVPWSECHQSYKNDMYDASIELLAKLYRNDFTGPDNHND